MIVFFSGVHILSYTVTFDADGGEVATKTVTQAYNTTIDEEPEATKIGFYLDGWYDGETKVTFPYTIKGNVTLKAKWTEDKTFVVLYEEATGVKYAGQDTRYERVKQSEGLTLLKASDVTVNSVSVLTGWQVRPAEAEAGTGTVYKPGEKVELTGNVLVTPVLASGYFVDFDGDYLVKVADGDAVEVPEGADERIGMTFKYWATEKTVDGVKVYTEFDITTPITEAVVNAYDYTGANDATLKLYAQWEADDLEIVPYDDQYETTPAISKYIAGLAVSKDALSAEEEVNEIEVSYDSWIVETKDKDGNVIASPKASDQKLTVFVKAPEKLANNDKITYGIAEMNESGFAAWNPAGLTTLNTALVELKTNKAGTETIKGAKIEIDPTKPYVVLKFKYDPTDANGTNTSDTDAYNSALYVIHFTTPVAGEDVAQVSVNLDLTANGTMTKQGVKTYTAGTDYYYSYKVLVPVGTTFETPATGLLTKVVTTGDPAVTTKSAFKGLKVTTDELNAPVEPVDGVYTINESAAVKFEWTEAKNITFVNNISNDGKDATGYTGPKMKATTAPEGSVYVLPECEYERDGKVFAGWNIYNTATTPAKQTINGISLFPVGYEKDVTADFILAPAWADGYTVTLSSGLNDDPNTEADETWKTKVTFVDGVDTLSYNVPNTVDEVDFGEDFEIPEGYKFGGWVATYPGTGTNAGKACVLDAAGTVPNSEAVLAASSPVLNQNVTLESAAIQKNPTLTAYWIPDVTFTTADPEYVASWGTGNSVLFDESAANLPELVFTKDATDKAGMTYIVTTKDDAPVAYTYTTKGFGNPVPKGGHYFAYYLNIPADYALTNIKLTNSVSGDYNPLSGWYDIVGARNEKSDKITNVAIVDHTKPSNKVTHKFTWDHGVVETYTIDHSAFTYTWPVTFKWDNVGGTVTTETTQVINMEDGALLTVDGATAPTKEGFVFKNWNVTKIGTTDYTNHAFSAAEKLKVTGVTELKAVYDTAKVKVNVDLDGGTLSDYTVSGDGKIALPAKTGEVVYGKTIVLPSDTYAKKPGYLLKDWLVDGDVTAAGVEVPVTAETTIKAEWVTYLGTLAVADLKDATTPSKTLYKAGTYVVGEYVDVDEDPTTDAEFVDLNGKTGTCADGNVVNVVIRAEELVKHGNETLYGTGMTGKYIVGLKITPPEGLGIAKYFMTGMSGYEDIPAAGYVAKYIDVTTDITPAQNLTVRWQLADGTKLDGVNYKITTKTTKKAATYTLSFTKTEYADDATHYAAAADVQLLTDAARVYDEGQYIAPIDLPSTSTYYWSQEKLDAMDVPDGVHLSIEKKDNGVDTLLLISFDQLGTFGAATLDGTGNGEIKVDLDAIFEAKKTAPALRAADFVFTADGEQSGTLKNNSIYAVEYVVGTATPTNPYKPLAVGATASLDDAKLKTASQLNVRTPATYDQAAGTAQQPTVTAADAAPVVGSTNDVVVIDTKIAGVAKYVKLKNSTTKTYQYRLATETTWHDAEPDENGYLQLTSAVYYFRFKFSGNKLASAPSNAANLAGESPLPASGKTVSVYETASSPTATTYSVDPATGKATTVPAGKYVIMGTSIEVDITADTVYNDSVALVKKS